MNEDKPTTMCGAPWILLAGKLKGRVMPCRNPVRGGGRCYMHADKAAQPAWTNEIVMLPALKQPSTPMEDDYGR